MANYDKLARDIRELRREVRSASQANQAAHTTIEDGAIRSRDRDGNLQLLIGRQDDGSSTVKHVEGPTPLVLSTPLVEVDGPVVRVAWDGRTQGGETQFEDFARADVIAADEFGERVVGNLGSREGTEVIFKSRVSGTVSVWLVARSLSGKTSQPSDIVEVEVAFPSLEEKLREADDALADLRESLEGLDLSELPQLREDLDAARGRLSDAETAITDAFGQLEEIPGQISAAQQAAIDAAAADAQTKATAAQSAAEQAAQALVDAIEKGASPEDIAALQEYADQAADAARAAAEAAAQGFANTVPRPLHGTAVPTTNAPAAPDGSVYFRHQTNLSGRVIAQYNRVGGAWVSTPIDDSAIANLDVGKLTAGAAAIAEVVSQKIAAAVGAFLELDVGQLTVTGQSNLNDVVAERIASAVGKFLELEVGKLVAGEGVLDEAVINRLWSEIVVAGMAVADEFIGENAILENAVKARHVDAEAIDGMVITGPTIQTSHEHPKTMLSPTGFHITDAEGADIVNLTANPDGEDRNYFGITDSDGSTLANISDEGIISGRGLNIEEDPVFMGKELLGTQAEFSHPSEFEADGMLDFVPRGMIARAYRNNAGRSAFTNTETDILEFSYEHEPSRAYKIVIAPFSIYVDGGNAYGYLNVYISTDGSRPRADGNPTFRQLVRNPSSSRALYSFGGEFYHVTDLPPTTVRILYTFTADGGQVSFFGNVSGAAIRTWVEDMGLSVPDTGVDRNDRREITSTVPPPAPTEPERRNYTKTYKATSGRTFWTSGGYRTDNTQYAYQGNGPTGGSQRSIVLFPSMTGDLSGAEITAMRVYIYFEHWYYSSGGEAKIHAHSRSDLPTSIPAMQGMVTSSNWPKPGGRWVNIPKEYWNNFRTGDYKGIGLGNPTGNRTQYGYARISSMKIEVKYRK